MLKIEVNDNDARLELEGKTSELCAQMAIAVEAFVNGILSQKYENDNDMQSDAAAIATGMAIAVKRGYQAAKRKKERQ